MEFRPTKHWFRESLSTFLFGVAFLVAYFLLVPELFATALVFPAVFCCLLPIAWSVLKSKRCRVTIEEREILDSGVFRTERFQISEIAKAKVTHMVSDHEEYLALHLHNGSTHKVGRTLKNEAHFEMIRLLIPDHETHRLGCWYHRGSAAPSS